MGRSVKRAAIALIVAVGLVGARLLAARSPSRVPGPLPSTPLREAFASGVDSLSAALSTLDNALIAASPNDIRMAFRFARGAYRRQETLLAVYTPTVTSSLNGPLENDGDGARMPLGSPAAFQAIEQRIFREGVLPDSDRIESRYSVRHMRDDVAYFRSIMGFIEVNEAGMLDAARSELARVTTLTLAGFDSDQSGNQTVEAAESLEGIRSLARVAAASRRSKGPPENWAALDRTLGGAIAQLRAHPQSDNLDRLDFIVRYANPVSRAIQQLRRDMGPRKDTLRVVWRTEAATVFDSGAFDATAYSPDFAVPPRPDVIALGERLFNDRTLSGPQTRSCASCHIPALAFADGLPKHAAIGATRRPVARNTPTLLNAALQPSQFADARAANLEAQINVVLASPDEMASSAELAAQRVKANPSYRDAFQKLSSLTHRDTITSASLRAVLAAYIRSLSPLDSRFDAAVRGNLAALTIEERRGFTLFLGKARCGSCHFAPLFNGALPPMFTTMEPEIIGVPTKADTLHATLDPDLGRAGYDGIPQHRHAFKTPSLRNVGRTAPYMHNGAYATLEQVVDFYNRGGGAAVGADIPTQTLARRPLNLSAAERSDLVVFLKSLDDR